jgi:hypothetical protein
VAADLHRIKMVPIKEGKASVSKCKPGHFAMVHWTAKLASNNKLVEDTKKKFGANQPEEILVGARHTVRCLDLTLA